MKKVPGGMPPNEIGATIRDPFWDARPELRTIHTYAHSAIESPWAVLAGVLATVAECIPPSVVLPPLGNGADATASLNVFFGIVGASGQGKGASGRVADGVLQPQGATRDRVAVPIGSGEGIAAEFLKADADKSLAPEFQVRDTSVRFNVNEIDTYTSLLARQGAIVDAEVRRLWSGENLGTANANPATRRIIPADMHRGTIIMGIQPVRADGLLGTAGGGTLQRMVFLPGGDPNTPWETPARPDPLDWESPWPTLPTSSKMLVSVAGEVSEEMRLDRVRRQREGGDPLKSHRNLSKLKIAALLAALDGRRDVNPDDWALGELIMRESDHQLDIIRAACAETKAAAQRALGVATAEREQAADDAKAKLYQQKILDLVADGEWHGWGEFRKAQRSDNRELCDSLLQRLEASGFIERRDVQTRGSVQVQVRAKRVDANRLESGDISVHPSSSANSRGSRGGHDRSTVVHPNEKKGGRVDQPGPPLDPRVLGDREGWTQKSTLTEHSRSTLSPGASCRACGRRFSPPWGSARPICDDCKEKGVA